MNGIQLETKGKQKIKCGNGSVNYFKVMNVIKWIGCIQNTKLWKDNIAEMAKEFN